MEKVILHLSDLHYDKKYVKDLSIVLSALEEDIKKQSKKIDYILFNGDLVNRGSDKESFNFVKEGFISPILELTGLTENEFFIVPGNHDVDRDSINSFVDGDLSGKFNDRDILNKFIDSIDQQKQLLVRLDKFHNFRDELHRNNQSIHTQNPLYSTYILNKDNNEDIKIGLACLNSSWCAFGGDDDYGKILLGERQVDNAIEDLKDCDYKIAMIHHPLEWLKEFDRESVYDRLITGFNMVLTGHIHSQNYKDIAFDSHNTIFLKTASLFQGRNLNGYSLINLNFSTNEVEVLFREYFEGGRRVFGKAERIAEDGKRVFHLANQQDNGLLKKNIIIRKILKERAFSDINNKLLSVASDSLAPKNINEIFVLPILTTNPESSNKANEQIMNEEDIELNDILNNEENVLFIGKKEMGKTTLINYICNHYLRKHDNYRIPVIIDFNDIPKGKNVFLKSIQSFFINYDINDFEVIKNLEKGNFIILIDNFNLKNDKNITKFKEFTSLFNQNRFILAMKEDILQTLKVKDLPDLGFEYLTFYINAFRRGQIRQLVKNWFSFKEVDEDQILNYVLTSMKQIGVPRTPMFISLMLWILEKEANFTPVNEASVIENFIETLLEKLHPDEGKYETIGFKIKIDFLAYLAKEMIKDDKYFIETPVFEQLFVSYFNNIGLEIDTKLKETFFEKGILLKVNDVVYFRFTCFFEYFLAYEMNEDSELYNFITNENNYLDFANEIIYYTGLNQKSKSYEVLKLIEGRLLEAFKDLDKIIDVRELSKLPVKELLISLKDSESVTEKIESIKISEDERDIILDDTLVTDDSTTYVKERKNRFKEDFIYNLMLYSNVLKNCELVEVELKIHALKISIEKYSILIGLLYKILYGSAAEEIEQGKSIETDEDFMNMITLGVPLVMQATILKDLGSPKLKVVISKLIDRVQTDFEKLLLICLYGDLRLEGYIQKFHILFKNTQSVLIKEIITAKLLYYQAFFTMPKLEQEQLIALLSDILVEKNNIKNQLAKGQFRQELLKRNLLSKHRKTIE
ncbi:hypothetical protein ABE61_18115 [Lysinibacillus sphaericus]|uniref:metallophosphoesterase n=1 Tax=Lysinibacillus sphaericus TaxID=1421 RepID=UPI0018CF84C0|nr:metallophosphoesterase [Lysinibacillus sphaericus]MBG9455914.1 hypothetical protein [Lysinibacillus sphaericus]MBG9479679.1 hypothetical protein [Lysinibacillus sphaericus]MBG9593455.1 hypothetical protein [Lysinibacillus sphaericus]